MREDVHTTRQLHCQWWSGQCHAKHTENAASVHNACLDKIVCCLQAIFNRKWKLKQQVSKLNALKFGVCVCVFKNNACYIFICIFCQIHQNSELLVSRGSAATHWRYGAKYYMDFVGNLLLFPAVKEFWKSGKNWRSYRQEFGVLLFWVTVYM